MGVEDVSPRQRAAQAKQRIKVWEGEYRASHGCPPDREAMAQAPEDIRHAYKTYRYYRKAVAGQNASTHDRIKTSERDKETPLTSHDPKEGILARGKEAGSVTHDSKGDGLARRDEEVLLRRSSSGDSSNSCADNLASSHRDATHEEEGGGARGQEVLGVGGVDDCDANVALTSDTGTSMAPGTRSRGLTSDSQAENTNTSGTPVNTSPTGTAPSPTPAARFADTTCTAWGKHLNKGSSRPKEVKKDTSLYTKMAEKLRAKSTIKMRKSLSRVSSVSKPQEKLAALGVSSTQASGSNTPIGTPGAPNNSKGYASDSLSAGKVTRVNGDETLHSDSHASTPGSSGVLDANSSGNVDEIQPMSVFKAMDASGSEEFTPFGEAGVDPDRPTSIFDAIESKSLEAHREKNNVVRPKPLLSALDAIESDPFEKTPRYHEVPSSQDTPAVQPISLLSTLGHTHTSGLPGIRKRAPLNLDWVARCTGMPLEEKEEGEEREGESGGAAGRRAEPQDSWKMKLIDREWSEEAEEREPAAEEEYHDPYMYSATENASRSTKPADEPSLTANPPRTSKANVVSATNANSKRPTETPLHSPSLDANPPPTRPTKTNARKPPAKTTTTTTTRRKPVKKHPATLTKAAAAAQRKSDAPPMPSSDNSNTGRVPRTRSTRRNTPKPVYAEESDDDEDYGTGTGTGTGTGNGRQKRRMKDDDEDWNALGDAESLEDHTRVDHYVDEEPEDPESQPDISEACRRKRRKVETLEELEEQGKIQSQWPPPKKKRIARKKATPRGRPRKLDKENSPKVKRQVRRRSIMKPVEENGEEEDEVEEKGLLACKENSPRIKREVRKQRNMVMRAKEEQEEEEDELEVEEKGLEAGTSPQPPAPGKGYDETDDIESHGPKNTVTKGRYLTGKERLLKKISTGSLNNNFVRINLKKKVYVRGKKTMTGAKYKRQEWKKRQLMRSAEGGNEAAVKNLTCFKCGDFGHWAKSCPGKMGDKLTPLEQYDEKESTFLSLEEAASMALGIKKAQTGPLVSKLYPKPAETENGDQTAAAAAPSESNTEGGVSGSISQESQEQAGDSEEREIAAANGDPQAIPTAPDKDHSLGIDGQTASPSEPQATSAVTKSDDFPDSQPNTTSDTDQDNTKQEAAGSAEDDFMGSDDDIFGNFEETDFEEQQQQQQQEPEPSRAQETAPSTPHFSTSQSCSAPWEERPTVEPLYALSDGEVIPTTEEVHDALREFGYPSFRPGQEDAIMRILSGQSTLLVLSTGSGKSLCYQLPAYLYAKRRSPCITLCVSPLVSLMEDQVMGLPRFLKAVCLHTQQNPTQRSQALSAIHSKEAHILLVSPEAVVASRTGGVLGTLLRELPPVAFACLDEAHCVSEWSHNFRPSYLRVCQVLRERLGVKTILGLTATARHATALSIARHLLIDDFDTGVIRGTSVPDNLQLSVSRDRNREEALVSLLQGERFSGCSSVIIYCTRRDECERVATLIRTQLLDPSKIDVKSNLKRNRGLSFDAEAYHAGLSAHRRHQVQKRFMSGRLRIVVATVAFGMGIDKSDVRGIIHFNMPRNVESYVQEIGRAGRDGEEAHCHLFLDDQDGRDIQELKRHIFVNSIDRHTIRKLLNKIFKPCTCAKLKSLSLGGEEEDKSASPDSPSSPIHSSPPSEDTEARSIGTAADPYSVNTTPSCCPRHEVAIPIEAVVEELDLPEENLATLLCYLELHQGNLIRINSHVYANCTVSCYGGPRQLVAVSRQCPPLAVAIALERQKGKDFATSNRVSFPVVEVASRMGWNSKIVKRELKSLEWNTLGLQGGGGVKRSGAVVEMTDLSFHLEARGDLSDDERDRVLDSVYRRSKVQELDQLRQLHYTYQLLRSVSHSTILFCCDSVDRERCDRLRTELREYFRSDGALAEVQVEEKGSVRPEVECGIRTSVRAFLSTYSDQQWTGRAVARVFHGIGSPNYPTEVWGRVRRYWRQHLNADFNVLVNIATQEILRCK